MDKEKEIEEMAKTLYAPELEKQNNGYGELCHCRKWYEDEPCKEKHKCHYYTSIAKRLQENGYGNIEQAVREFAESIQNQLNNILKKFKTKPTDDLTQAIYSISNKIDDLIKERFGYCDCETCPDNNNAEYNERNCPNRDNCGR